MIRYNLTCDGGHAFDAWFSSSSDYDRQAATGLLACPACNSTSVRKAIMAPAVATSKESEERQPVALLDAQAEALQRMAEIVRAIRANSTDVGDRFAEEARRIHYGEAEARGIIGRAETEEVRSLLEEGIEILPLPRLPEEAN